MLKNKLLALWQRPYWLGLILLLVPIVINAFIYRGGIVFESTVYSVNYHKYFHDLFVEKTNFFTGLHSIQLISYFALYGLLYLGAVIFGNAVGYFVVVGLLIWLGYHYLIRLLQLIDRQFEGETLPGTPFRQVLISLLFFSSLAMFNFLKSNIIFLLPYLMLPALLYWALSYIEQGRAKYLALMLALLLLATSLNITHLILITGFTWLVVGLYGAVSLRLPWRSWLKRMVPIAAVFLPSFIFLFTVVVTNSLYGGSVTDFASTVSENFYSQGAHYLNIFLQTTDWGLFGGWQNVLYYGFSPYYQIGLVGVFGLIPFLLAVGLIVRPPRQRATWLALWLLVVGLVIFQFMLGFNNPIYRYLYQNLFGFQIFRNITKAAPLLFLTILLVVYLLAKVRTSRLIQAVVTAGLLLSLIYNLPYWTATKVFFRDRAVKTVPAEMSEAATYLNGNLTVNDRVMVLPATYILEQYQWPEGLKNVQGDLFDGLLNNQIQTYHIGEILIGPLEMQQDMGKLFVPSDLSVRGKDLDYPALTRFAQKYGLDYVVVSDSLLSEYQRLSDIYAWLPQAGYQKVADFGSLHLYQNPQFRPASSPSLQVDRINSVESKLTLSGLSTSTTIDALTYNSNWQLHFDNRLRSGTVLAATHRIGPGFRNEWQITPSDLANWPKSSYVQAADGSYTVTLYAFFGAQKYLDYGMLLALLVFLGVAAPISYAMLRRKP